MRKKKVLAAALLGGMSLSLLSGCGGQNALAPAQPAGNAASGESAKIVTEPGEFPIVKEPITLKVLAIDETYVGPLEEVDFFKWYEEKTGIHIEWQEIPREGYKEKLNLMLSTGNLPDVILGMKLSTSDVFSYGQDGTFLQLDDYIEKYGVEIKKVMEQNDLVEEMITFPDGHIYSLPEVNECRQNSYRIRSWINTEWLDALGLDMPRTTEEFEAVLQAFKDGDPNGNGIADEIPLLGDNLLKNSVVPWLMNAFIYMNASDLQDESTLYLYMDENEKIQFAPNKEKYKEGLKWIHGLVEKGLLDSTSFTQDETQFQQVLQSTPVRVGVMRADLPNSYFGEYNDTPDHRITQYEVLEPLIGPDGFQYQPSYLYSSINVGNFVITSACQYPEAAFRWADGWYSEEASFLAWYGAEGKGWEQPPEGSLGLNGEKALYKRFPVEVNQTVRVTNRLGYNSSKLRDGEMYVEDDPLQKWATDPLLHFATVDHLEKYADPDRVVPPLKLTREEVSEVSNIRTMVNNYVDENQALFCLGTRDIDKEWDQYVKEFSVLGLDRMLEIYQAAYDRQYK